MAWMCNLIGHKFSKKGKSEQKFIETKLIYKNCLRCGASK